MDSTLQTSFIPKQTITSKPSLSGDSNPFSLFTLISVIILLMAALSAGGTFAYKKLLLSQLYAPCETTSETAASPESPVSERNMQCGGLRVVLENYKNGLQEERLLKMKRLDVKMKKAADILGAHMSLVPVFDLLSTTTLKTVRYTKFQVQNLNVTMEGLASSYEDIAVQSNLLNRNKTIKDALFSDLNLDAKGNVIFKLSFNLDRRLVNYQEMIRTGQF